jgi:signal transduction histidine kinase
VGLRNMRDRIDALHGRLEITASPGREAMVAGAVAVT